MLGPTAFSARRRRSSYAGLTTVHELDSPAHSAAPTPDGSPMKADLARRAKEAPSLLLESTFAVEEDELAEVEGLVDVSFSEVNACEKVFGRAAGFEKEKEKEKGSPAKMRAVLQDKENIIPL